LSNIKFKVLRKFLDQNTVDKIVQRMDTLYKAKQYTIDDQCPRSISFYSSGQQNIPIETIRERLEQEFGVGKLIYTFDYARIYQTNEILSRHIDRYACQYSVTINLKNIGQPWDFHIEDPESSKQYTIKMSPGDAVIYCGCKLPHWRNTYNGTSVYQCFVHFCDSDLWPAISDQEKRVIDFKKKEKYLTTMRSLFDFKK